MNTGPTKPTTAARNLHRRPTMTLTTAEKNAKNHLDQHVDDRIVRIHQSLDYAWTARCLGLIQDAQDIGQALVPDDRDQILRTTVDESP